MSSLQPNSTSNDVVRMFQWCDAFAQSIVDILRDHHLKIVVWLALGAGLVLFLRLVMKLCRFVITQFFRKPHNLIERYGQGSWAVISGSSGGIGLGFAVELAKKGFNIVLISRTDSHLQAAEKEVRLANPCIEVRRIIADFSRSHNASFWDSTILPQLAGLDISILVNNVGINHTESFATIPENFVHDIVQVNCTSQIVFTRKLIRRLLERTGWRDEQSISTAPPPRSTNNKPLRSAIISVSSVAGQRPLLYLSPYSATKAFNDYFSRALSLEFPEHLDVLSLRPGYVVSNMSKLKEASGFVLDRYECARGCLEKLGYVNETYGDPRHAVYARSFFLIPEVILAQRRRQRLVEKNSLIAEQQGNGAAQTEPGNDEFAGAAEEERPSTNGASFLRRRATAAREDA
ncbi:short chain dehydrogenase, putative [Bodo saltans]|uniref:Short chain dehydrogenase, putative n=1 Tax=Bodo saltans TaxID=75058 RepID=A0A0S4JSF1_BODSA|nr:short chain dehydrogenase, putative [Bodo saltans]|eukprot:CUG93153.1 short chain dehydrogenase, putative [Bodo saltans]